MDTPETFTRYSTASVSNQIFDFTEIKQSGLEQIPGVAETCNFEAIMDGYYKTLFPLNPGSICPAIPSGSQHDELTKPHDRGSLSSAKIDVNVLVS